ncbi:MAG: PSD1 and planctomycete cytochrome C domain-containing protein [Chthonomonadales bacterium]
MKPGWKVQLVISGAVIPLCALLVASHISLASTQAKRVEFNSEILPILKAHCYECHAGEKNAGGLRLDNRASAFKGGAGGPSLVAGNPAKSPLLDRIMGLGGKPRMPIGFAPLTDAQTVLIKTWIAQGADWPDASRAKKHWAYINPVKPAIPTVRNAAWIRNPIDSFVLSRIEKAGLKPAPEADRTTLIRRLTLDLIGLPPTVAEVQEFLADRSPNAYEKVVDRLLANPHFGEKMALPWLDAARYADSNGFQQDGDTFQYVWRDWVVKAYNDNMPFDQFTIEQLAGDLLPNATLDQKIASGFNRCHLLNGEGGAIAEEQRNVILFDRVEVTSTNWMGVTMMCSQCHDHKYDPFTMKDYYSLMAFFNNVPESGVPPGGGQYRIADPWIEASSDSEKATLKELDSKFSDLDKTVKEMDKDPAKNPMGKDPAPELKAARDRRQSAQRDRDNYKNNLPRVMVMSDAQPRKTYILQRGNYLAPGLEVTSTTPAYLPAEPADFPKNRLGLAKWFVSRENPLTARVHANRIWQIFFGLGLVKSAENFGVQCELPTNPELLDWLAVQFREGSKASKNLSETAPWDMKALIRLIVTSATYRQSSKVTAQLWERDPENRLLARAPRFRMPSLILRDIALSTSGLLNDKIGGKPVYPYQPIDIWEGLAITKERDFTYPQSKGADLYRRSLYTFWRRTVAPGNMFDASVRNTCKVRTSSTSTPLHALTTLNDITWVEASRNLAQHVIKEHAGSAPGMIAKAFQIVCARQPEKTETLALTRIFNRATAEFSANQKSAEAFLKIGDSVRDASIPVAEHAALTAACLAIYNLDEAMTRE